MLPWAALLGSLGLNYRQHRRGQPTICSATRSKIPALLADSALLAGYIVLRGHVVRGYGER